MIDMAIVCQKSSDVTLMTAIEARKMNSSTFVHVDKEDQNIAASFMKQSLH
jgi:hypothetical protein